MNSETVRKYASTIGFYWLPLVLYLGLIFYCSSRLLTFKSAIWQYDKLLHFCEFTGLSILFSRALFNTFKGMRLSTVLIISTIFGFIYGTIDEYQQSFVPGRTADMNDAIADAAGAFAGALFYSCLSLVPSGWIRRIADQAARLGVVQWTKRLF